MNEEQPPISNTEPALPTKNDWKHHFTTVTPLSKAVAMMLFIALPFIGFWLGMNCTVLMDSFKEHQIEWPSLPPAPAEIKADTPTNPNIQAEVDYKERFISYYPREIVGPVDDSYNNVLSWSTWAGLIVDIFSRGTTTLIAVDKVGLYENGGSCRLMVGGFCVVNEVNSIELLELAPEAYITLHWGCSDYEKEPVYSTPLIREDGLGVETGCSVPFEVGRDSLLQSDVSNIYYWFDFNEAGKVVHIVQQYVP